MIKTIGDLKEQISMLGDAIRLLTGLYTNHIIKERIKSGNRDVTVDLSNLNSLDLDGSLSKLDWDKEEDLLIINEKYCEDYFYMKKKCQELGLI